MSAGGWFAAHSIIYNLFFERKCFCRTLACKNLNTLTRHYVIPIKLFQLCGRLLRLALGLLELGEYKHSLISRSCSSNSGHVSQGLAEGNQ